MWFTLVSLLEAHLEDSPRWRSELPSRPEKYRSRVGKGGWLRLSIALLRPEQQTTGCGCLSANFSVPESPFRCCFFSKRPYVVPPQTLIGLSSHFKVSTVQLFGLFALLTTIHVNNFTVWNSCTFRCILMIREGLLVYYFHPHFVNTCLPHTPSKWSNVCKGVQLLHVAPQTSGNSSRWNTINLEPQNHPPPKKKKSKRRE